MAARLALALVNRRTTPSVIVIRGDRLLQIGAPAYSTLELMPTQASIERNDQLWLPLLPQRGLLSRDPNRGDAMATVALKAYSYNVPTWMNDDFRASLGELGFRLRVDDEHSGRWPDFREVDVVLCTHPIETLGDERRKPPTKLVNAWRAGAIPICGNYMGYREIGVVDETMLLAEDSAADTVRVLRRLREEPGLAHRIRSALPGDDFAPERIAESYWEAFESAPPAQRLAVSAEAARSLVEEAMQRALRRGRYLVRGRD